MKTYSPECTCGWDSAVAIHVDPDVLLVDEVLAVGDEGFTHKCLDKFAEFKRRGKTILLVTHSLAWSDRFWDEALVMDAARLKAPANPSASLARTSPTWMISEERQLAATDAKAGNRPRRFHRRAVVGAPPRQPIETGDRSGGHVSRD